MSRRHLINGRQNVVPAQLSFLVCFLYPERFTIRQRVGGSYNFFCLPLVGFDFGDVALTDDGAHERGGLVGDLGGFENLESGRQDRVEPGSDCDRRNDLTQDDVHVVSLSRKAQRQRATERHSRAGAEALRERNRNLCAAQGTDEHVHHFKMGKQTDISTTRETHPNAANGFGLFRPNERLEFLALFLLCAFATVAKHGRAQLLLFVDHTA